MSQRFIFLWGSFLSFAFGAAYLMAYFNPMRNRLTRLFDSSLRRRYTRLDMRNTRLQMLIVAVVCLGAVLLFLIQAFRPPH